MGNKAKSKRKHVFSLATFNVRGLSKENKQNQLARDIEKYNVDICCLQEVKIKEVVDKNVGNCRLITVGAEMKDYGNGFMISSKWKDAISNYWKVSERISVIQIKTNKSIKNKNINDNNYHTILNGTKMKISKTKQTRHTITIINVYAPTTERVIENFKELDIMYTQLNDLVNKFKKLSTSLVCIATRK